MELNINQANSKVTGTLTASNSSGTVQFDPVAGRVVSMKRTVSLGGMLSVDANGMTIPIDNQQELTNTFELLEKLSE